MKLIPEPAGGGRRRIRRVYLLAGALVIAAMAFAVVSLAGTVGTNSGFEDDDANLVAGSTVDWNSFAPVTWNGTAPKRLTTSTASGWSMSGFEDYIATTSDDGFAGGVKQDFDCGTLKPGKAPNKDDLKRVYLATKTVKVNNVPHVFLSLAFVRIPLNSTQSSTHIGFEFNEQRLGACASGPLAKRTPQAYGTTNNQPPHSGGDPSNPGDLLIVYDYEGSTTSPTLSLRHWIDTGSTIGQSCEISSDSPPCWSTATTLPAGVAEAQVNFGANGVPGAGITDALAPADSTDGSTSANQTLGLKEFGEAGVDLTAAGVFTSGVCTAFGQTEAVSRSSGNSGSAAMEDLVSGPFTLNNCGEIKIIKQTKPRGLDQKFSFSSGTVSGTLGLSQNSSAGGVAQPDCSATPSGQTPTAGVDATGHFCLNDKDNANKAAPPAFGASDNNGSGSSTANTVDETNLQPGTYTITEGANPNGFAFDSVTCKVNGTTTTLNTQADPKTVTINLSANDVVVCIYQNNQQLGAINVTKTAKNANCAGANPPTGCSSGKAPLGSVGFEIWQESNSTTGLQTTANGQTPADTKVKTEQSTASDGTTCFGSLAFADSTHPYYVHESTIPTGYTPGTNQQDQTVTISANSTCAGSPVQVGVENVPLSRIEVKFTSLAGTGVTRAQIVCKDSSNATVAANSENGSNDNSSGQSGTDPTFDDSDELFGNGTSGLKPGVYNCEVNVDP